MGLRATEDSNLAVQTLFVCLSSESNHLLIFFLTTSELVLHRDNSKCSSFGRRAPRIPTFHPAFLTFNRLRRLWAFSFVCRNFGGRDDCG